MLREDPIFAKSLWGEVRRSLNTTRLGVIWERYTLISNCPSCFLERLFVPQGGSHYTAAGHVGPFKGNPSKQTQDQHFDGSAPAHFGNNEWGE